jgi:hypothetical protein
VDWLPNLLKNLTLSRTFSGALFLASFFLLALPHFREDLIEPVPVGWRWLVAGICIFSGALLFFWSVHGVWKLLLKVPASARNFMPARPLSEAEKAFLIFMGTDFPNESFNADDMRHKHTSKLELLEMCKQLQVAGLVSINPIYDNLISLTGKGREKALLLGNPPSD